MWVISNAVTQDLYHNIYNGEIFQQSQCIWHENTVLDFIRHNLRVLGYQSQSDSNKTWQRGDRRVVVCLVDDFTTCSTDYSTALPYLFDRNTVVITDNFVSVPTQYRVCQLPSSFFGIYRHEPAQTQWQPTRRFNFSVNRLDTKRMLLMLELWSRCQLMPDAATLDYVNFNCWSWGGQNDSESGLRGNFEQQWSYLDDNFREVYESAYHGLLPRMPWRNHKLDHNTSHVSAWVNVVAETYSSDTTVAVSEKIFRALCTPVPWVVYSGRNTVAYLHSLGFDVMRDVIEHRYDSMIENKTAAYGDKMVDFIFEGADAVAAMQSQDFDKLSVRCAQAAQHNQQLLASMQHQWPADFAAWWSNTVQFIV